jgi:ribosomal protein S4E
MNRSEKVIRDYAQKISDIRQSVRDDLKEHFFDDVLRDGKFPQGFFDKISVEVNGEKHRLYRGFYELLVRAVKKHRRKLIEAAKLGRSFAREIAGMSNGKDTK